MNNLPELVAFLNTLIQCDPAAMHMLMNFRIACLPALSSQPHVKAIPIAGNYMIGWLGILNAFLLTQSEGYIIFANFDQRGALASFSLGPKDHA